MVIYEDRFFLGTVKEIAQWMKDEYWFDVNLSKDYKQSNSLPEIERSIMEWYGIRRLYSPFVDINITLFADEYGGGKMKLKRFLEYPSHMDRFPEALKSFINELMETDDNSIIFGEIIYDGGLRCSG